MNPKPAPVRSQKIRDFAKDKTCTLRLPGICAGTTETTVHAHMPFGGRGMARKASDLHGAHACVNCHDVVDGRQRAALDRGEILECCIRGIGETQQRLIEAGLLKVPGAT